MMWDHGLIPLLVPSSCCILMCILHSRSSCLTVLQPSQCLLVCMQMMTEAGGTYLEAPVSGSKAPAEQGTLIFLCGGDKALFDRSADLLDVMGKAKLFLGQVWTQQVSKHAGQHVAQCLNSTSSHL